MTLVGRTLAGRYDARFRTEIKLARRVTHANVARTFELGWADGLMFCTMELVEGESLAALLARRARLPVAQAVAIACALCDALTAAHEAAVIHRDIKPANVLIANDDGASCSPTSASPRRS